MGNRRWELGCYVVVSGSGCRESWSVDAYVEEPPKFAAILSESLFEKMS